MIPLPSPEIEKGEDEDPDEVDEMPVQPGDLDRAVIAGAVIMAARDLIGDDQQQDDAAGHMQPVEAGDHEEAGAKLRRSEEHTSELQSLMRISYAVFCLKKKKHRTDYTYTKSS